MGIRSNGRHYWDWVKINFARWNLPTVLLAEGWITGDPHALNFADLIIRGLRRFRLADIDDSGRGYFFFDIVKFVAATRAAEIGISNRDLIDVYWAGLQLKEFDKPKTIRDGLKSDSKTDLREEAELVNGYTKDGRFVLHTKGGLISKAETALDVASLIAELEPIARRAVSPARVLDVAVRIKSTGGSQFVPRLWLLVEAPAGRRRIFEFKLMTVPAVEATHPQLPPPDRIAQLLKVYWKGETDPDFRVLAVGPNWFWMRPRQPSRLVDDRTTTAKQRGHMRDVSLYIAYQMGKMVARQSSSLKYRAFFASDFEHVAAAIEQIASEYVTEASTQHDLDGAH